MIGHLLAISLLLFTPVYAKPQTVGQTKLFPSADVSKSASNAAGAFGDLLGATTVDSTTWTAVLQKYYGDTFDPSLPAWVVYIPKSGDIRQGLVYNNKLPGYLPGERTLWIAVFVERSTAATKPCTIKPASKSVSERAEKKTVIEEQTSTGTTRTETTSVETSSSSTNETPAACETKNPWPDTLKYTEPLGGKLRVIYTRMDDYIGPGEYMVRGLAKAFAKSKTPLSELPDIDEPSEKAEVDIATVSLHPLAADPSVPWYFGTSAITLKPNTSNRLMLVPGDDLTFKGTSLKAAVVNFGNGDSSYFGASLCAGTAFNTKENLTPYKSVGNIYALAHVYPWSPLRPARPWRGGSFSIAIGTGLLRDRFFHDLITGVAFGHLFGSGGVVTGIQWSEWQSPERHFWKAAPFIGIDLAL